MATNTTATTQNHNGTGSQNNFAISFSFLANTEVEVKVGGVLKTLGTHYNIVGSQVQFTSGNTPPSGTANVVFTRDTNISAKKVDFADGSVLTETDLDNNSDQILFAQQEIINDFVKRDGTQTVTGNLVFEGATDDGNETTLAITDPTDDRTITVPDRSGTLITSGDTGTVTSTMIADGTIVNGDIANTTITGGKLVNDTITSTQIGANAVTASELADNAVDTNAVQDDAITYSKIQNVSATDRVLGRDSSGAGVIEEITPANLRTMINVEDGATADQTASEIRALVESASDSNVFTDADHSKLNAIEANADVTDATNVNAAGAVMNSDLDTKGEILVGDGSGDPTALPVGQNGYILTADSSEATGIKWAANAGGGGGGAIGNVVEDTTPQLGGNLDVQANEINTSTTNGNIKLNPNGTGVVEIKGDGSSADGTLQLNCSQNSHGVKIKSPAHSASASYTLTLPVNVVNGQFLKTDTNGVLSWAAVDLTALSASNLTSGTVPDARFPATLPAASAANLTSIPAGNLTGTVADARISTLTASKLTGALPAIDGSNLTGITAGAQGGGGESIFFESENTMDNDYTITANHNAMVAGPLTINATLTVNSPSVLTLV